MELARWTTKQIPQLEQQKNKKNIDSSLKSYAKYSGIAFKMAIIIVLGTFGGYKIDECFGFEKHIITLILSLLSVVFAIYVVIKDFIKK